MRECTNKPVTDNVTPDVIHILLEEVGGYETRVFLNSLNKQKLIHLVHIISSCLRTHFCVCLL